MRRRLSFFFAKRYLFSRKSHSVINIISGVSAFTVAIPVAAMIILLSVYNGLNGLLESMYSKFDAPLQISAVEGKVFDLAGLDTAKIRAVKGVETITAVLEENALFVYRGKQHIGILRGVDPAYGTVIPVDSMIVRGEYALKYGDLDQAVIGMGVAYSLNVGMNMTDAIEVVVPRRQRISSIIPLESIKSDIVFPAGIFALEAEIDKQYIIVPLDFARRLLDYDNKASWIGIGVNDKADIAAVQQELRKLAGDQFKVLNRFEQKETLYTIMRYEKFGIYFVLLLVLIIASFSLIGSLVMLIIDKRKDIFTLRTFGGGNPFIRQLFISEGMLISGIGMMAGLLLGIVVIILQQKFGFVKISGESFLIKAYPVRLQFFDVLTVIFSVLAVNCLIAAITVRSLITTKEERL